MNNEKRLSTSARAAAQGWHIVTFEIPKEELEVFDELAKREDLSRSQFLRRLVRQACNKNLGGDAQ